MKEATGFMEREFVVSQVARRPLGFLTRPAWVWYYHGLFPSMMCQSHEADCPAVFGTLEPLTQGLPQSLVPPNWKNKTYTLERTSSLP